MMDEASTDRPPAGSRSWVKWVALGCGGLVVLGALAATAILFVVFAALKRSDVYREAVDRARSHPDVVTALGDPVEPGWFVSGSVNVSGPGGEASLAIPLAGPAGEGTLYVEATKEAGTWRYHTMEVAVEGDGPRIDLLGTILASEEAVASGPAASGGIAGLAAPAVAPPAAESEPEAGVGLPGRAEEQVAALPVVVFLGDSLTAGYGLAEEQAWPAVLEERFAAQGLPFRAINAGVSGDTSAGGLRRLEWVLRTRPDVVVVELGANEGLRGLELAPVEENLRQVVRKSRAAGARVLLVGLQIPPNYGPDYTRRFAEIYPRLAGELDVPLVPFLLEGVGGERDLNLGDGVHPNVEGHRRVAQVVEPHLRPLVEAATTEAAGDGTRAAAGAA